MNDRDMELVANISFDPTQASMNDYWELTEHDLEELINSVRADEREACAKDADWCLQNHLEHLIPARIRARGNK